MVLVDITVDVYCGHLHDAQPNYRIYIDGELLTERTWRWTPYKVYIQEHIEVNLEPGDHNILIDNSKSESTFNLKNLLVRGVPFDPHYSPPSEIIPTGWINPNKPKKIHVVPVYQNLGFTV